MKKILVWLLLIGVCGLAYGADGSGVERAPAIRKTTGGYTMGNVGLGTTDTSAAKLTVAGDVSVSGTVTANNVVLSGTGERLTLDDTYIDGNDNTTAGVMRVGGTGNTNNNYLDIDFETTAGAVNLDANGDAITFSENVGVGTTAPTESFEVVNGSIKSDINLILGSKVSPNTTVQEGSSAELFYYDANFTDDESFTISVGNRKGAGPNITGDYWGTNGVDSFENSAVFSLYYANSDVNLPAGYSINGIDNDGGTIASPLNDYVLQSNALAYTGTYSLKVNVDGAYEILNIANQFNTGNTWYRFKIKEYSSLAFLDFLAESSSGIKFFSVNNGATTNAWVPLTMDVYMDSDFLSINPPIKMNNSSPATYYLDDYSKEIIEPFTGTGMAICGPETAYFTIYTTETLLHDGETAMLESDRANVTETTSDTIFTTGTKSAKFEIGAGFTTGVFGSLVINHDFIYDNLIQFDVYSSVALNARDISFAIDNSANLASPTTFFSCPTMAADTWYTVTMSFSSTASGNYQPYPVSSAISIGYIMNVDKGAMDFYSDNVKSISYGNVALLGNSSTNTASSDSDGDFCVYKESYKINPTFKNRLGTTQEVKIWVKK